MLIEDVAGGLVSNGHASDVGKNGPGFRRKPSHYLFVDSPFREKAFSAQIARSRLHQLQTALPWTSYTMSKASYGGKDGSPMSVVAESALEVGAEIDSNAQVLCNFEINNKCRFTTDCGDTCILNQLAPRTPALKPDAVQKAGQEIAEFGRTIRHVVIAGKEPMETPERVLSFLKAYHDQPPDRRPGAVGLLTSGINLDRHIDRFAATPLSWCITSVDADQSGLRSTQSSQTTNTLRTLRRLKEKGGAKQIGVNSVVAMDAETELPALAEEIEAVGIDQWALSPLMVPGRGSNEAVSAPVPTRPAA